MNFLKSVKKSMHHRRYTHFFDQGSYHPTVLTKMFLPRRLKIFGSLSTGNKSGYIVDPVLSTLTRKNAETPPLTRSTNNCELKGFHMRLKPRWGVRRKQKFISVQFRTNMFDNISNNFFKEGVILDILSYIPERIEKLESTKTFKQVF